MKKGFTLIELLAVIVILAIIALIATPVILNIINDSKVQAQKRSIEMYGDALTKAAANYYLKHPTETGVTLQQLNDENLINYNGEKVECEVTRINQNGNVYLSKCKVGNVDVEYKYGKKEEALCRLVDDTGEPGLSRGDIYTCEVIEGMKDPYTFYVLGIEGTGDNKKVNLIMDRNICENGTEATSTNTCLMAWYVSNDDTSNGPVTAMQGIYNATKNWDNVPNMNLDYPDEGYIANSSYGYGKIQTTTTGIKITKKDGETEVIGVNNQTPVISYEAGKSLKARMPKLEEVYNTDEDDNHCHYSYGSCPAWLTNGLDQFSTYYPDNYHVAGVYGYWLLASSQVNTKACRVYYTGLGSFDMNTSDISHAGIRPVITVSLSDLR